MQQRESGTCHEALRGRRESSGKDVYIGNTMLYIHLTTCHYILTVCHIFKISSLFQMCKELRKYILYI